jgi:hypothetical protein
VSGFGLEVRDSFYFPLAGAPQGTAALVYLSDREDACEALAASQEPPGSSSLWLQLFRIDGAGTLEPLATGAYQGATRVDQAGGFALGRFSRTGEACEALVPEPAGTVTGGSVTLERLAEAPERPLVGRFELTFGPGGEKGTGSFSARPCPVTALPASPVCL